MKKYLWILLILLLALQAPAQLFYNKGAPVTIASGGILQINGGIENAVSGNLENKGSVTITGDFINNATAGGDGTYTISGNWINNNTFNSGTGSVILNGAAQNISGSVLTHFYNLTFTGSGIKTQTIDQNVMHILSLNDRELATGIHTMFVTNTDPSAITRTNGFVSSMAQGSLSRSVYNPVPYLFPVGSSAGTLRYRPVEVVPSIASANNFTVRMANTDATSEGFDRTSADSTVCATNPLFYHHINRSAGTSSADLRVYFDNALDGNWQGLANWDNTALHWQNTGTNTVNSGTPLSYVALANWNNFGSSPYILIRNQTIVSILPVDSICSNYIPFTLTASEPGGIWTGTGIIDTNTGLFSPDVSGIGSFMITYSIPGYCGGTGNREVRVVDCSVNNIYIPNIFSPNGDNQNDVLFVRGDYKSLHLTIYDRWGEKVFETHDGTIGWNGTYKNQQVNPGVFAYYAEIELMNGSIVTKKGNITLVK